MGAGFAVVLGHSRRRLGDLADQIPGVAVMTAVLSFVFSDTTVFKIDLRVRHLAATLAIGVGVFVLWIAPDVLVKGYRHFWLFENALLPKVETSLSGVGAADLDTRARIAHGARGVDRANRGRVVLAGVADAVDRRSGFRESAARDIHRAIVLDCRGAVRLGARTVLGRRPGGGNHLQLVDGAHEESRRPDTGACSNKFQPERLCDRDGQMGILVMTMEQVRPGASAANAKVAFFDFDGTLSLVRSGWMDVMVPMMVEILADLKSGETEAELKAVVEDFVWRLTGKETIFYQMIEFAANVEKRGGKPLDPLAYKKMYLDLLWGADPEPRGGVESGHVSAREVHGSRGEDAAGKFEGARPSRCIWRAAPMKRT